MLDTVLVKAREGFRSANVVKKVLLIPLKVKRIQVRTRIA